VAARSRVGRRRRDDPRDANASGPEQLDAAVECAFPTVLDVGRVQVSAEILAKDLKSVALAQAMRG
jgi:hypothetical protein